MKESKSAVHLTATQDTSEKAKEWKRSLYLQVENGEKIKRQPEIT